MVDFKLNQQSTNTKNNGIGNLQNINQLKLQGLKSEQASFRQLIDKKELEKSNITISKHAQKRIVQRGIDMDSTLYSKLNDAIIKGEEKGARDMAVVTSQGIFIVNVPNKTIVTGLDKEEMRDNIFTNIDSAVII